ncbi:MAG: carboxypeptidase regulatory-like domain-containing protein [Thermoanaerobaculales bacterium]|jgi:protocatechuate 3,4-dioxygenase beta subunit|nr:carboxypeptidase regulatory-like domain-containing protein [Thermoanaerobaculales bacterium]
MKLSGGRRSGLAVVLWLGLALAGASAEAGSIGGVVTDPGAAPLADIEVSAFTDSTTGWRLAAFTETAADGSYLLDGLADGAYRVLFRDWGQVWAFEVHPDATRLDGGLDVLVDGGATTVDAALVPAGLITGRVTDANGVPVEYPIVFVYSAGTDPEVLFVGQVDPATGDYQVGGLPTGDYLMMFSGRRGSTSWTEYFENALRLADATPIAVVAGATTGGIDGELGPPAGGYPGGVQGLVTDITGAPLAEIEVSLYTEVGPGEWDLATYQTTAADGGFLFDQVPDGTYTLGFRDWAQAYAFVYWGGGSRLADAVPFEVSGAMLTADAIMELGGRISGVLTDPAGEPLDNALVFALTSDDPPQVLFLTNPDQATGLYELGGLPTGDYLVQFSGWQGLASYVGYYDGAESVDLAQPVPVTIGQTTAGIDGELGIPPGGVIAGRITDRYGNAFDTSRVLAYRWDGADWVLAGQAETLYYESSYELPLPPGSYRLLFEAASFLQPDLPAREFFDNVLTIDLATDVSVTLGQRIEGFDVVVGDLAEGSLTGTVTDAATGTPLAGIEVWVSDRRGRSLYDQVASSGADGTFEVAGLWPEGYTVELYDPGFVYQTESVGPVLVGEGPVTVDAALEAAPPGSLPGAIAGSVVDDLGAPLFGIRVSAENLDGSSFGSGYSNSSGAFRIRHLYADSYRIRFASADGFQVSEYYDDVLDPDGATPVPVAGSAVTAGIDAELAPAGIITGSITNRFGGSFFIATAIAYRFDGVEWQPIGSDSVVSETDYRIDGLPVGTSRVQLIGRSSATSSLTEFFDDAPTIELATEVPIVGGQVTTGISGSLGQGPPGALTGAVTDGSGQPLQGIEVRAWDDRFELAGETATGPDGTWEIIELYAGRYSVEFSDPQGVYPGEAWNDVASLELATPILVGDGPVTGIDAALDGSGPGPGGGGIRGLVTDDSTGAGVGGIRVRCFDELFGFVDGCSVVTDADGSYRLGGFLESGSYTLLFSAPDGDWVDEWYDGVRPPEQPTPVAVVEGAWTDGVDAGLEPAGAIAGTVTNQGGNAYSRLNVTAFRWQGGVWQPFAVTDSFYDTDYELGGLPQGAYRIRFRGGSIFNFNFASEEFYDDVATIDAAVDVTVQVGVTTTGIDAVLGNLNGGVSGLDNPSFDDSLEPWGQGASGGAIVHHGQLDVTGSALSGSAEIVHAGDPGTTVLSQCLAVDADAGLRFGGWSQVTTAPQAAPTVRARLAFHDDAACTGVPLGLASSASLTGPSGWRPVTGVATAPPGAVAARLTLELESHGPEGFTARWDEAFVDVAAEVVLADGFESGSTGLWSLGEP